MKLTNNEKDKFTYNTLSFVISVIVVRLCRFFYHRKEKLRYSSK